MSKAEALSTIEAALNVAIQKGIFADLQSAMVVYNCLQILKAEPVQDNQEKQPS